jgi:hypothetical protein
MGKPKDDGISSAIWFTPRIWFGEGERIGMQKCTPIGYALNGLGGLLWFAGILALFGVPPYLAYRAVAGNFGWTLLWLLVAPFAIVFIGSLFIGTSWLLASLKGFHYDYERDESTWNQAGKKRSYSSREMNGAQSNK